MKKLVIVLLAVCAALVCCSFALRCFAKYQAYKHPEFREYTDPVTGKTTTNMADYFMALSLYDQAAEKTLRRQYAKYLPEELVGAGKFFGIDRDKDEYTAYVYLRLEEYAVFKGSAYSMSGVSGEAVLRYTMKGEGEPALKEIIWCASGAGNDKWLKKRFPRPFYEKARAYVSQNGQEKLAKETKGRLKEKRCVSTETEDLLEIDRDTGKYKIIKTRETGEPGKDYKFETETVEEGVLEPGGAEKEQ